MDLSKKSNQFISTKRDDIHQSIGGERRRRLLLATLFQQILTATRVIYTWQANIERV